MKNLLIASFIGLLFMGGGFWFGMKLMPVPSAPGKGIAAAASTTAASAANASTISLDALKKTSETMMSLNEALQIRERNVAAREQKVKQQEDEIAAERSALDRSHEKFKALFDEFQQRLQLVEASQMDQLQKQASLYESMGADQSVDLVRAMDDASVTRLFSVMDDKILAKMISEWKTKYPGDTPRLLAALNSMAEVQPKEKIALSEPTVPSDSSSPDASPAPTSPAPDAATPAATPDPTTTATPDPGTMAGAPADPNTTSTPASDPNATSPAPSDANSNPAGPNSAPDPASAPASTPPTDPNSTQPLAPPPDTAPSTPTNPAAVSTAATN
jgi:hypothetical protein